MLPWLLKGFGTQVRVRFWAQNNAHAFVRKRTSDTVFTKGNNYYHEVECKAEGESATKVCRNIVYGKDKKP